MLKICGIFGIYGNKDAAKLAHLGLQLLQHRGQESAGIISGSIRKLRIHRGMGLVSQVFDEDIIKGLKGDKAVGHVRYSTAGPSLLVNAQPLYVDTHLGKIACAHNGTLTNYRRLRERLEKEGSIFQTKVDSEVILHLFAKSRSNNLEDVLRNSLKDVRGAYSLLMLTKKEMIAVRDPFGFRPLSLGSLDDSYVSSSETCAFDIIGAEYIRDVEPGEAIIIDENGLKSSKLFPQADRAYCIFEHIYFSRPDSTVFGCNVDNVRKEFGRQLAREHPVEADVVISVPDSGNSMALGYAEESGIKFDIGLIRSHYMGRTFIEPQQSRRDTGVMLKYNPCRTVLDGKRVVVVEDSIVRGTNIGPLVGMIRQIERAREVHVRVGSPPYEHPCFYGIDTPEKKHLIASHSSVEDIKTRIGADSLGYLSIEGMLRSEPIPKKDFCLACFNGEYKRP